MEAYPQYKNSGVEWIGNIPVDWSIKPFKFMFRFLNGYAFKSNSYVEEGIPILRIGDVKPQINFDEAKKVPDSMLDAVSEYLVKPNDLLLALTGATVGKSCIYNYETVALLNQRVAILRSFNDVSQAYLNYILISDFFREYVFLQCAGGAQGNIGKEEIGNYHTAFPPLNEQQQIANYLDHKTQQIDTLIAKKQRLIDLLKEERTAVINEAVTKGIDPDVPMKDSGIEWLGDVPEHWSTPRLKLLTSIISKGTTPSTIGRKTMDTGEVRFIKAENIKDNALTVTPSHFIDPETDQLLKRSRLMENDILFVIAGATIGKVAMLTNDFIPSNTNQAVCFIRLKHKADSAFMWYWLQSPKVQELIWIDAVQAAQPNLSMENLGNFYCPYPPANEKNEIVRYLDKETTRIDTIITNASKEIDLLKEYRTA